MDFITDLILSIPFGIIYYFFIDKLINVSLDEIGYDNKYQQSLIIIFIIGLIGLILAFTLFKNNPYFKNRTLQFGLILGNVLLLFYSIISNWNDIDDFTKVIIFSIMLGILIWYYYYTRKSDKLLVNKNYKKIKNKK